MTKRKLTITEMARLGGQTKSAKRAAASKLNGAKGGRPRKNVDKPNPPSKLL